MSQFKVVVSNTVKATYTGSGLRLNITDESGREFQHFFPEKTKMFQQFIQMGSIQEFEALYTNAPFVFVLSEFDWRLVDFRNNRYNGFIQKEDVLSELSDNLGLEFKKNTLILGSNKYTYRFDANDQSENEFESSLLFKFSPFTSHVSCDVGLERLICLNGMTTNASIFNYKIPVFNNVRENLEVAIKQIAPSIQNSLKYHIEKLQFEKASLAECNRSHNFVAGRICERNSPDETYLLRNLLNITDVNLHCREYGREILESPLSSKHRASHLTRFDIWNILTELDSHTRETKDSKSSSVQRYINTIMFNSATFCEKNERAHNTFANRSARFNATHTQAFFGKK